MLRHHREMQDELDDRTTPPCDGTPVRREPGGTLATRRIGTPPAFDRVARRTRKWGLIRTRFVLTVSRQPRVPFTLGQYNGWKNMFVGFSELLRDLDNRVRFAVELYWSNLSLQANQQRQGDADRGNRAAVTAGKQMVGFSACCAWGLQQAGVSDTDIHFNSRVELPGFYRSSKKWDVLAFHRGDLVAAIELKSQRGPSFGNNFNNRAEEAIGSAVDLWAAWREGNLGKVRPWLGWLMLLEDCPKTRDPVGVSEPHFPVRDEFRGTGYMERYALLARKLMAEKQYDRTALLLSAASQVQRGDYSEPMPDLSVRQFFAALVGHAMGVCGGGMADAT